MDEVTAAALIQIAKELQAEGVELARYLAKLAENAGQQRNYYARIRDPFPLNERLRVWLGNVDDRATVRLEGTHVTVGGNQDPYDSYVSFSTPGKRLVILELVNSLSGPTRCDFRILSRSRKLIEASPQDFDTPPYGLQRNYVWSFDVR